MDTKSLALIVTAVTVLANVVFALSGITSTVSCTVSSVVMQAYAAVKE